MSDSDEIMRPSGSVTSAVYEAAVKLLAERHGEGFSEVTSWVTGSEISHATGISKDAVLDALTSLGDGSLHIRTKDVGNDIEVSGVDHGSSTG